MNDMELALRRSPLFCDLSSGVLSEILSEASSEYFSPGDYLFTIGGIPDRLFVLVDGSVKMVAGAHNKNETVIELLQPADSFLIAAVMTNKPYLMSAQAIGTVHVLTIPAQALRQHVVSEPQLALTLIASLANQCRQMVRDVKDLRLRTSFQRLGVYLLEQADKASGRATIVLPHVKKLIASRLNMTPENLSRAIHSLQEYGVEVVEDEVRLHDIAALRRFCKVETILGELDDEFVVLTER